MSRKNNNEITVTILGEPASKANSRKIVKFGNRPAVIKSDKARSYEKSFAEQCLTLNELITVDVEAIIIIYYASRRPDLDESVILDCLQGKIYENDRQVKEKHIYWALDKDNPRATVTIRPLQENLSEGSQAGS